MNFLSHDVPGRNCACRRLSLLGRYIIVAGLAACLFAGCVNSAPREPSLSGARRMSSTGATPPSEKAASDRKDSQPKTVNEFLAQEPVGVPFNNQGTSR